MEVYEEGGLSHDGKWVEHGLLSAADYQGWRSKAYWHQDEEQQDDLSGVVREGWQALSHRVEEGGDLRVLC